MGSMLFRVEVKQVEDKMWRVIGIDERRTMADLAYAILASFETLAYHLYQIKFKKKIYDCGIDVELDFSEEKLDDATRTRIGNVNIKPGEAMEMWYDFGTPMLYRIIFLGREDDELTGLCGGEMTEDSEMPPIPCVVRGAGKGGLDDIHNGELEEIIREIDTTGKLTRYTIRADGRLGNLYDYRNFNLGNNRARVRRMFGKIKEGYEGE